jgi:small subunit ribosomal protein S7
MRRRTADKRVILPDPKYKNLMISKFINMMMLGGKKSTAEKIMYQAMDIATQKTEEANPVVLVEKAVTQVRPLLQLKARRVGGATYQVPVEVRPEKGLSMAMRWIRDAARSRKGKSMQQKLAEELCDAFKNQGTAVKKRDEVHKMAEANRAFSHYRW